MVGALSALEWGVHRWCIQDLAHACLPFGLWRHTGTREADVWQCCGVGNVDCTLSGWLAGAPAPCTDRKSHRELKIWQNVASVAVMR